MEAFLNIKWQAYISRCLVFSVKETWEFVNSQTGLLMSWHTFSGWERTCLLVRVGCILQTVCWEREYWGRWLSRVLQACFECALSNTKYVPFVEYHQISLWFIHKLLILSPNSPTTSSRTSFHSISFPDSCTMVTVTLLWMPCYVNVELFDVIT